MNETPTETTPGETTPAETTPAETTPAETTPGETTPAGTPTKETWPRRRGGSGARVDRTPTVAQEPLPFDQIPPIAVPYDDEADQPIAFSLTARARRVVAPDALPALRVIDDDGALEPPNDTRPARARALHRAGVSIDDIGRQLDVDDLVVRAWLGSLVATSPTRRARPPRHDHERPGVAAAPRSGVDLPDPPAFRAPPVARIGPRTRAVDEVAATDDLWRDAVEEARRRLTDDPRFALGVGMLASLAATDRFSVTLISDRAEAVGAVMGWLYEHAQVDVATPRVILRLGEQAAADLERHRWSDKVGVPIGRISFTRSGGIRPSSTVAFVRIHDPILASRVTGWCDALLDPRDLTADAAF